jgi:predicted metal-dependent HD superfamily phosphohydrolase
VRKSRQRPVSKERQALTGRYPWLDQYVTGIIKRTGRTNRRKLQKLLDLQRTYPPEAFRCAVEKALRYNLYDLHRLENLILSFIAGEFFNLKPED